MLKVENNRILVEFSLTQPKRAWKIRKKSNVKRNPRFGYIIERGDFFEWMISNEEVTDILSVLNCVSKERYDKIKKAVYRITKNEFKGEKVEEEIASGIIIDTKLLGKQWKRTELTPYLFVLFALDATTGAYYLVDKRSKRIEETIEHKVKAGDKLVWIIESDWIEKIVVGLASLDEAHNKRVKKDIFEKIENNVRNSHLTLFLL